MNTTTIRSVMIAAASLSTITVSHPAGATLPGDGYYNWNYGASPAGDIVTVDTGIKVSEMTCFLSKVSGDLEGYANAVAEVVPPWLDDNNPDWLVTYGNTGGGSVSVSISCVWGATNVVYAGFNNTGTEVFSGTDSKSQCFLQGISTEDDYSFSNIDAKAVVSKNSSGAWQLETFNLATDPDNDIDSTYTYAVCVDVPGVSWFEQNNETGNFVVTQFEQTSSAPEVCGLRGVAGTFAGNGDSVGVYAPGSLPGHWELEATGGDVDAGWITCMQ